ncbi:MAG: phosphatase PAP2 family protein [Nocardioides sp.]
MKWSELTARRHDPWTWVALQVLVVAVAVATYFGVRGRTESALGPARRHARDVFDLERWLHIDVESALQRPLRSSGTLETLANWIYIWGHWPVLIATMAWLVWRHRQQFLRLRNAMLVSGSLGLVVFVVFPTAPPRLAGLGYVDTVTLRSSSYRYLQPPAFVNQYAAVPSLHVGWDLLACVAICSATTWWWLRALACSLPVLMTWAVLATGNHFVVDVVAGVTLVVFGHAVALAYERRNARRPAAERRPEEAPRVPAHASPGPGRRPG